MVTLYSIFAFAVIPFQHSPKCVTVPKKSFGFMKLARALTEMLQVGRRGTNLMGTVVRL